MCRTGAAGGGQGEWEWRARDHSHPPFPPDPRPIPPTPALPPRTAATHTPPTARPRPATARMSTQSWLDRRHALDRLGRDRFDVLVIGGGITGAGVARDAALRGLRVALVERHDLASGTSSRSSRLVHGGVRYLEHGQLRLVFEASRERRLLLKLAPHLVRPLAFTWPVYRGARVPRWKLGAGLLLYDVLARFGNVGRHERLDAAGVLRHEPALRSDGLAGGARYWDARTDDARLTVATALAAADADATVLNHCAAIALTSGGGRITGAVVRDAFGGGERTVRADVVVNATGPWSDEVRALDASGAAPGATVRGTKGVHVLVPRDRVGNAGAVTLLSPVDGRVMFVLPAGRFALVGTTETRTETHPAEVRASAADVDYLLASVNAVFPAAALEPADVVSAWAGIRPLVASDGDVEGGRASREHALAWSRAGLLSITGGKLTTYRSMAEEAVDAVVARANRRARPSLTGRTPLPGGELASVDAESAAAATTLGDTALAERLVAAHGTRWRRVWQLTDADRRLREPVHPDVRLTGAEVAFAVRHELAATPGDVLVRRSHVAYETPDAGRAAAEPVAALMGAMLGWDDATRRQMVADYDAESRRLFGVDAADDAGATAA